MKKTCVVAVLLAFLVFAGCEIEEPEPEPEEVVKTPEEIMQVIAQDLAPLRGLMGGVDIGQQEIDGIINRLRAHRATFQGEPNAEIAFARITAELEQIIEVVREMEQWRVVLYCLDVYEALNPGAIKYNRLRNMAELQVRKPRVSLKAFITDGGTDGDVYAFVEIRDPVKNEVHNERMREGEEMHGLRFHRVIGNQRGVEFEYLAIPGDFFEVMK